MERFNKPEKWRPKWAPKVFLIPLMALTAGCAEVALETENSYSIGTSGGEFLSATLEAEEEALLGVSDPSSTSGLRDYRPDYRLSSSFDVSAKRSYSAKVSQKSYVSGSLAAHLGHLGFNLPDGVLLGNGITRLTDPIDLTFLYVGLRPEVGIHRTGHIGKFDTDFGLGAGYAVQHVEIAAKSALLDYSTSNFAKTPYVFLSARVAGGGQSGRVEAYYKRGSNDFENVSIAYRRAF